MKNQMQSYTCLTKPFVLFVLLITLGVGQLLAADYLKGSWDGWSGGPEFVDGVATLEITKVDSYEFKIFNNDSGDKWTGCSSSATVTSSNTSVTLADKGKGNNIGFTADRAGLYTFTISGSTVTVTYPTTRTYNSGQKIYLKDVASAVNWNGDGAAYWGQYGKVYACFSGNGTSWSAAATAVSGSEGAASTIYEITVPGSGKKYTTVYFARGSNTSSIWNRTPDQSSTVGYNCFYISSTKTDNKYNGPWGKYAKTPALIGSFNDWDPDQGTFTDGRVILDLPAETDYEFKVLVGDGSDGNNYWSCTACGKATNTVDPWQQLYSNQNNWSMKTGEEGEYMFHWNNDTHYLGIYYPQTRLTKNTVLYFNVSNETYWNKNTFDAKFWFKYYDSGSDYSNTPLVCSTPVETNVYYVTIPNNDWLGRVQIERWKNGSKDGTAEVSQAFNRSSSAQNCLKEEAGKTDYKDYWTPQWDTYCPPMSKPTLSDNSPTTYGGNGTSGSPYLVAAGSSITFTASGSTSSVNDANMTAKYQFKDGATSKQDGTGTSYTHTVSSTNNANHTITVEAYNYYNSVSSNHTASDAIYYQARTIYDITYNKGTYGEGDQIVEKKADGVVKTLRGSGSFTRTGYNQTAWNTDPAGTGGTNYALSASYTGNAALTLYPTWTAKEYTINLANMEATTAGTESVDVTFDASTNMTSAITKPTKTHYDFGGYWTSDDLGEHLGVKLIDENGNWIKDVEGYTSHDGSGNPTWVHDYAISLFAKWTEHEYAVTLAVSPEGAGTTSPSSSTTAKYVTASSDITATPNSGYSFSEWDFSKTDAVNDIYCAAGKTSTSNPVQIHAVHAGTLTANFTPNTYTVRFENLGADAGHKGSLDTTVTFNDSIHMKGRIEFPSKTNYDFGGYYISTDQGATLTNIQIIDANGNWNKNVSGYTGEKDGVASWVCAGDTVLYAKWTETAYTITPSVSPAGTGSVNIVTDAHLITPSSEITATPANAAWVFDHWELGTHVGIAGGKGTTDNHITVTSDMNSTLTAYFKPRYVLVGSIWDDNTGEPSGGMPGWMSHEYGADFTFNSFTALGTGDGKGVDLSCSRTLTANTTYKFQIYDRIDGNYGYRPGSDPVYLGDGDSFLFDDANKDVMLRATGAGIYTFRITNITESTGQYYPTVIIERPHQVYFGTGYAGIDNLSSVTSGTTGGTLVVTTSAGSLSNEDWVDYGTDVTYTPSAATGYTFEGFYTSDAYSSWFTQDNPWVHYNVTGDDHVFAKFEEKSTSVTLANDGKGHITIGGDTETSTTCGVTTTRELNAVPNDGYRFSSWTKTSGDDITLSSTSTNPTTLRGQGAGATSGQTVTANFTYRWALSAQSDGWGSSEFIIGNIATVSGDVVGYVDISLAANTNYEFTMKDLLTNDIYKSGSDRVYYMSIDNHSDWAFATNKTYNCGITTAGKGTYRFTWNVTDKTMTVTYPDSYQVNFGASVGGSVSVVDDDSRVVPNGGYVRSGGSVTYTATPNDGYTFVGWCGNDSYGEPFTTYNPWTNSSVAATSNAYAKFKSTNFVIYRTGDKEDDPRAALDDVESYGGGTISETIEFRMKVRELDMWYTLCLPFTVSAVKVWDEEDGAYYGVEPYYRENVGDPINGGHYIIRTPKQTTDLPIADFGDWRDPTSPTDYVPTKNKPYIIQWHNTYFLNKYISFFGGTGQAIPTSMTTGVAPSSENVVNVHGNNSMKSGSVAGVYLLEADYGNGAWLRDEDATKARTIKPFECYVRASSGTTGRYLVIRRGMTIEDTATAWENVVNSETKTHIVVYSISGICITQFHDCSINEAGQRLSESYGEGLYILRADNESVKLMVGGR